MKKYTYRLNEIANVMVKTTHYDINTSAMKELHFNNEAFIYLKRLECQKKS